MPFGTGDSRRVYIVGLVVLVVLGIAFYALGNYAANRGARSGAAVARDITNTLGSIHFRRVGAHPARAVVLFGQDTVASVADTGRFVVGIDTSRTLLLLGRWLNTKAAQIARGSSELYGHLEISPDSTEIVIRLESRGEQRGRVTGYLIVAPDTRWVPLR